MHKEINEERKEAAILTEPGLIGGNSDNKAQQLIKVRQNEKLTDFFFLMKTGDALFIATTKTRN